MLANGGAAQVQLVAGLVLAEFDVEKGSCVRAYYPRSQQPANAAGDTSDERSRLLRSFLHAVQKGHIAGSMLPDGAEKQDVTRAVLITNRPAVPAELEVPVFYFTRAAPEEGAMWVRDTRPNEPSAQPATPVFATASHVLLVHRRRAVLSLRGNGQVLWAEVPITLDALQVMPDVPQEVKPFVQTLLVRAFLQGDGAVSRGRSVGAEEAVTVPTTTGWADPVFVAVRTAEREVGLLMHPLHAQEMLRLVRAVLKPPTPTPVVDDVSDAHDNVAGASDHTTAAEEEEAVGTTSEEQTITDQANAKNARSGDAGNKATAVQPETSKAEEEGDSHPYSPLSAASGDITDAKPQSRSEVTGGTATSTAAMTTAAVASFLVDKMTSVRVVDAEGGAAAAAVTEAGGSTTQDQQGVDSTTVPSDTAGDGIAPQKMATTAIAKDNSEVVEEEEEEEEEEEGTERAMTLYGLCAVVSKRSSASRRGGVTKAVAVFGPSLIWLEPFFPILVEAVQYCCDIPGSDHDAIQQQMKVLKLCYESLQAASPLLDTAITTTTRLVDEVEKCATSGASRQLSCVTYRDAPFGTTHRMSIPISPSSQDVSFTRCGLERLLELLGPSFMHLVLGIVTGRRILVLSRRGCATDVCEATLALGMLGGAIYRPFLAQRVFPYVSVSHATSFTRVPGYVAGTLNPIFANPRAWNWELLCDLDRGQVLWAERSDDGIGGGGGSSGAGHAVHTDPAYLAAPQPTMSAGVHRRPSPSHSPQGGTPLMSGWAAAAAAATLSTTNFITSALTGGGNSGGGDGAGYAHADLGGVRGLPAQALQMFKDMQEGVYHMRALRMPPDERTRRLRLMLEEFLTVTLLAGAVVGVDEAAEEVLQRSASLRGAFCTPAMATVRAQWQIAFPIESLSESVLLPDEPPALPLACAALRRCRGESTQGLLWLLCQLNKMLTSRARMLAFLRRMPTALDGLNPLGMQLTHASAEVRAAAMAVFAKIEELAVGKSVIAAMSSFLVYIYEDTRRRTLSTSVAG